MVFSSLTFLFIFLPVTLILYYISADKYKNLILLVTSLLFYSWGEPKYIVIMLFSIVANYLLALAINSSKKHRLKIFVVALLTNILLLGYFKYFNFFIDNINNLLNIELNVLKVVLPIGISFYTFQILSYVIDVYNKKVKVQKDIVKLGAYVTMFPQLIAGPIVRYETIMEELDNKKINIDNFYEGIKRFIIGLGKKVIIANNVAIISRTIFESGNFENFGMLLTWLGVISYTLQIYYDFNGYSDMAIGLGKMFGFNFLENFNYPYISKSVTDFWRRWHMSLSYWFRDYVYIPLGGSRNGSFNTYRNLLLVWLLTGLWHGASWNYVLWGLYYCVFLVFEKIIGLKIKEKIPNVLNWFVTFMIICIGWVIFMNEDLTKIPIVLKSLFNLSKMDILGMVRSYGYLAKYMPMIIIGLIGMTPVMKNIGKRYIKNQIITDICLIVIFIISIFYLVNGSYNPFIYFRF